MQFLRIYSILLFLISFEAFSRVCSDSLVKIEDINFHSTFEETQFKRFESGEKNFIELLLAVNPNNENLIVNSTKESLNNFIKNLRLEKIKNKKLEKQIAYVVKEVNEIILDKYSEKADFSNLFINGEFNCVSASALYAMIFDEIGLHYSIREQPNHVYIIADPGGVNTPIETTNPVNGFKPISTSEKKEFVDNLRAYKLISENEYNNYSVEEIYERYYLNDAHVDFKALISFQYYNKALFLMEQSKFKEALNEVLKAQFLNYSERNKSVIANICVRYLDLKKDYSDTEMQEFMCYYFRFAGDYIMDENLNFILQDIGNKYVLLANEYEIFKKTYGIFLNTKNDVEKKKLGATFLYYSAINFTRSNNIDSTLIYLLKAYQLDSSDVKVKHLIGEVYKDIYRINISSPDIAISFLEGLKSYFTFLNDNKWIENYALLYLQCAHTAFEYDKISKGVNFLNQFETLFDSRYISGIDEFIQSTYYYAWKAYVRAGKDTTAKKYLEKGLSMVPNGKDLQRAKSFY